ncbi:MAG: hypothetical protein FGM15_11590 [Chthoniobacterales bacterium]|nr:hypothetical protein [Chthoniobacterales bacterium]
MFVLRRLFSPWFRAGGAACGAWRRDEKLTVVLLSYGRAINLNTIVAACLTCPFVHRVILSNNNPSVDMRSFVRSKDPRLQSIQQQTRCYPSKRYELARDCGDQWLLCIDDDTFLTPFQIRALFEALLRDPAAPHGIAGENFAEAQGQVSYVFGRPGEPEEAACLVWAYAFTREHALRYFEILAEIGMDNSALKANEDIVLSLSGMKRPLVHNFGTLHLCGSRESEDVATSKQPGFRTQREDLFRRVSAISGLRTEQ